MNASTVFVCDSCAEAWRRAEAAERERDEARAELRGVRNFYRDVSSSLRAHMRALEAAEEELKIAVSHNAQLMIEAATVRADASIPWDSTPAENMRLRERIKALEAALRKSAQGWENVVELGLIPPQHRDTAEALRDECRSALSPSPKGWSTTVSEFCAACGYTRSEHNYNGGAYGLCGRFVVDDGSTTVSESDERAGLIEFARWAISEAWQGGDLDGCEIQKKAEDLGLIVPVPGGYNPDVHGPDDYAERGDPYFVIAPFLGAQQ